MADREESGSRTEEPTAKRRQQARDEGRIARSSEFSAATMLLLGTVLLGTAGGRTIGTALTRLFRTAPAWLVMDQPGMGGAVSLIRSLLIKMFVSALPFGVGLALVAIAVGLVQSRGAASAKPLAPDWSRVNPATGLKRLFGGESLINLVKSLVKMAVLGTVTYMVLRAAWPTFVALGDSPVGEIGKVLRNTMIKLGTTVGLAFMGIGALDYLVQNYRHEQTLKMSRQEIVQEQKEQEGDPQIKARIRQIARQRVRKMMLSQVRTADVVITNPTHIAVALKYDPEAAAAPMVLAIGERKLAQRIKEIAMEAGVPLVENKLLARALRATATAGSPIPPALYVAVAEILAFVYRMRGKMPSLMGAKTVRRNP
ncbi:MAG: EscU/YscU/HrcU family type III secretion system export apparatus switch protein [Gemmatimonadota bacterium]